VKMTEQQPANIKDILEKAGYTLVKISDEWIQIETKIPKKKHS